MVTVTRRLRERPAAVALLIRLDEVLKSFGLRLSKPMCLSIISGRTDFIYYRVGAIESTGSRTMPNRSQAIFAHAVLTKQPDHATGTHGRQFAVGGE